MSRPAGVLVCPRLERRSRLCEREKEKPDECMYAWVRACVRAGVLAHMRACVRECVLVRQCLFITQRNGHIYWNVRECVLVWLLA
jgi:hypothetical protein